MSSQTQESELAQRKRGKYVTSPRERPKRDRRDYRPYSPIVEESKKRRRKSPLSADKKSRKRGEVARGGSLTIARYSRLPPEYRFSKWAAYEDKCYFLTILFANQRRELMSPSQRSRHRRKHKASESAGHEVNDNKQKAEQVVLSRMIAEYKVQAVRKCLHNLLLNLAGENSEHVRFPSLVTDVDEEGNIELEDITCSACGEMEAEGNDILLCDKEGCYRAYHQKCLDPQVDPGNLFDANDWFCWQCDTVTNCLGWVNKAFPGKAFQSLHSACAYLALENEADTNAFDSIDFNPMAIVEAEIARRDKHFERLQMQTGHRGSDHIQRYPQNKSAAMTAAQVGHRSEVEAKAEADCSQWDLFERRVYRAIVCLLH